MTQQYYQSPCTLWTITFVPTANRVERSEQILLSLFWKQYLQTSLDFYWLSLRTSSITDGFFPFKTSSKIIWAWEVIIRVCWWHQCQQRQTRPSTYFVYSDFCLETSDRKIAMNSEMNVVQKTRVFLVTHHDHYAYHAHDTLDSTGG